MTTSSPRPSRRVLAFVAAVSGAGLAAIALAMSTGARESVDLYVLVLAALTVVTGRFPLKVPGQPASVSVSEVFIFAIVTLGRWPAATLLLAFDGTVASISQPHRRWYRTLFNIAEPAVSITGAGLLFQQFAPATPLAIAAMPSYVLASGAMALAYFGLNSLLTAAAVGIEAETSIFGTWRRHAAYLALNYFSAAPLALLIAACGRQAGIVAIGAVVPVIALSYAAYRTASRRLEEADQHACEITRLNTATVETLAMAVDAKDQVTHGHIRRVQRHALALARSLGVTDVTLLKAIEAASLLHDIGKLAIPDNVLNKPGKLNAREYHTMKSHAAIGAGILSTVDFPYPVVPIVRHHHESWDGKGYPDGLSGKDIPLGARILSVVDCFDAVTSDRPYRVKMSDQQGIDLLQERRATMYDPEVVDRFVELIPELRRADDAAHAERPESHHLSVEVPQALPAADDVEIGRLASVLAANSARIVQTVRHVLPDAEIALFIRHPAVELIEAVYLTEELARAVPILAIAIGTGLSGWVASARCRIENSDPALDLGAAAEALGIRTCTAVPVLIGGDLVGVLSVYSRWRELGTDEIRRISRIAHFAAVFYDEKSESIDVAPTWDRPRQVLH